MHGYGLILCYYTRLLLLLLLQTKQKTVPVNDGRLHLRYGSVNFRSKNNKFSVPSTVHSSIRLLRLFEEPNKSMTYDDVRLQTTILSSLLDVHQPFVQMDHVVLFFVFFLFLFLLFLRRGDPLKIKLSPLALDTKQTAKIEKLPGTLYVYCTQAMQYTWYKQEYSN